MMKRAVRIVFWLLVASGLAGLIIVSTRPQPVLIDIAIAERGPLVVTVDEDGITRIKERYIVSSPLAGRLQRISLEVGDAVTAHQTVIAQMQPTPPSLLDPRAAAQAQARVSAAERRLNAAQAQLKKSESEVEFAETELGRVRALYEKRAVSETELRTRELFFRSRTEEARAAGFSVDIAEFELELQRAALTVTGRSADSGDQPQAAGDMEFAIRAPIDGRVLRIYQESSAVLQAGESILELGDPEDLEVVADVLSFDAVKITPGARAELHNWGGQRPLSGEVRVVEPSGFTKLSALGVEEQRVNVIIDFGQPPQSRKSMGDGFRVDAKIVVWENDDVLKVPTSALFRVGQQWELFVVRDGLARQEKVEIGQSNGIQAEVVSGLKEGQTVIVHPGDSIHDGVMVLNRELAR